MRLKVCTSSVVMAEPSYVLRNVSEAQYGDVFWLYGHVLSTSTPICIEVMKSVEPGSWPCLWSRPLLATITRLRPYSDLLIALGYLGPSQFFRSMSYVTARSCFRV